MYHTHRSTLFEVNRLTLFIFLSVSVGVNVLLLSAFGHYLINETDTALQETTSTRNRATTAGLPDPITRSERNRRPAAGGSSDPKTRSERNRQPTTAGLPDLKTRRERNRQPTPAADGSSDPKTRSERNRQPTTVGLPDLKTRRERNRQSTPAGLPDLFMANTTVGLTNTLPGIILAGVQKGGTSSLSSWLKKNKICYSSKGKEVHHFDTSGQNTAYYQNLFRDCPNKLLALDATPRYMHNDATISKRIHSTYKQANELSTLKIICILREPVSRELSWYNHQAALTFEEAKATKATKAAKQKLRKMITFDEYVESTVFKSIEGKSSRGLYVNILRKWFTVFDRNQILILSKGELDTDPETMKHRIQLFLGVDFNDIAKGKGFPRANSKDNPMKQALPSCVSQGKLAPLFEPYNEQLYRFLENNPGPYMEQRPFPRFRLGNCTNSS